MTVAEIDALIEAAMNELTSARSERFQDRAIERRSVAEILAAIDALKQERARVSGNSSFTFGSVRKAQ
jgi:hypothetical protein